MDRRLLEIALHVNDPALLGRARFACGRTSMWQGQFIAAQEQFNEASQFSGTVVSSKRELSLGDWRVRNHSLASFALWVLGHPQKAIASSGDALSIARQTTSPADLLFALNWSVTLNLLLRNAQVARLLTDEAVRVASEHGLSALSALAAFWQAQALTQAGELEEGLFKTLQAGKELHHGVVRPLVSVGLAEVFLATRRPSEGLGAVDEGLAFCRKSGARAFESELQRLKGELLLMLDQTNETEAEQCFRDAIEIARCQSGKAWELRGVMSLARLLRNTARRDEVRTMLAEIYNWFTEGLDTADLKNAKVLLDQLSG
jgi:predicted negative regulator of RcsB-dependent stress response